MDEMSSQLLQIFCNDHHESRQEEGVKKWSVLAMLSESPSHPHTPMITTMLVLRPCICSDSEKHEKEC